MKKTLVALAVTAFAASASAVTVYDADGSKIDFDGRINLLLDNNGKKTDGKTTKRHHTNLRNDGSRFGVNVKHNLGEDFYALGRLEIRFNKGKNSDDFGNLYAHRAYVGLGSKQFGEVTFGRQVTIGDDIAQAGFDNTYGVTETPLTTSGNSVIRYDYKGVKGLQVGVNYNFADDRKDGEVNTKAKKSGYGVGVKYEHEIAEGQSATVAAGYTRDNFATGANFKAHRNAAAVGASYTINELTLAADYGYLRNNNRAEYVSEKDLTSGEKESVHSLAVGAKYQVTPMAAVYGNYVYLHGNESHEGELAAKARSHRFMLGTEYQFHKSVMAFIEGRVQKTNTTVGKTTSKSTDKSVGVGLRVFW